MYSLAVFQAAAIRHAQFYLEQLQRADSMVQANGKQMRAAVQLFEEHWAQIKQAHSWAAGNLHDPQSAAICRDIGQYGIRFLRVRQPIPERIEWLQTALEAARILNDAAAIAARLNDLGQVYLVGKNIEDARTCYEEALRIAQPKQRKATADALTGLGRIQQLQGTREEAKATLEQAAAIYREIDDPDGLGWCLHNLGTVKEWQRDFDGAREAVEQALHIFRALDDPLRTATALRRLGSIAEREQKYPLAERYLHEALRIAYEFQDLQIINGILVTLGLVKDMQNEREPSIRYFQEALSAATKIGNIPGMCVAYTNLGWMAEAAEDYAQAEHYFQEARQGYETLNYQKHIHMMDGCLAFVYLKTGDIRQANDYLYSALAGAHSVGDAGTMLEALLGIASLHAGADQAARSAELLGMILAHPHSSYDEVTERLNSIRLRERLTAALSPQELAAAEERGRALNWDATIRALLATRSTSASPEH